MGIDVSLQDERGKVLTAISDPHSLLPRLLERSIADAPQLAEIDFYGNTIFNRLQIPRFLSQWQIVGNHTKTEDEVRFVDEVRALAIQCQDSVHLYLKFIGD